MDKRLIVGAAAGCAVIAAIAASKKRSTEPKPAMWDKMRDAMEEMPTDFPPRIMFDNVQATRVATERILDLLEKQQALKDDIKAVSQS